MKRTILFVDNDPTAVELFTLALRRTESDARCLIAHNGEEALHLLRNDLLHLPRLIFLDLNMPRMNGIECLTELKKDKKLRDIPVVINTVSSAEEDKEKTMKLGALYFLTKPFVFEEFCEQISFVLSNVR